MRYLNKIIFINSAHIKYAEINLDGNIHFIGTQGVGKSTLLRAILFFYNADTQGLGIPKSKDSYVDYYFKNSNSYVIYEVIREEGNFCVVSYKSQHKVCFRFFDGEYNQDYFILENGYVPDNWDKIAQQLDKNKIFYTKRKIDEYEDYRDIIYGNHDGKKSELKKYSISESKDYQQVPKTIQNVFLNSKMEAEFIKQIIILSLDNNVLIDLTKYIHHLNDFEAQLMDIQNFKKPSTMQLAENISKLHIEIEYFEQEKIQLAKELAYAVKENEQREPELIKKAGTQQEQETAIKTKLNRINEHFKDKLEKINEKICIQNENFKRAKERIEYYNQKNIHEIIIKTNKRHDFEKEQSYLQNEKNLLSLQFFDIEARYKVMLDDLENQFFNFFNEKNRQKNEINTEYLIFKDNITKKFNEQISSLREEYKIQMDFLRTDCENKRQIISNLKNKKVKIEHTRFLENELLESEKKFQELKNLIKQLPLEKENLSKEIENIRKQWELDEQSLQKDFERNKSDIEKQAINIEKQIDEIEIYINNNKDSLYGWLTENYPNWKETIGKVIDEKNVLFNLSLNPHFVEKSDNFYGIEIDLNEIDKTVKTIEDYEEEKIELNKQITSFKQSIYDLEIKLNEDKEKLKYKYLPKIKDKKEELNKKEYNLEHSKMLLANEEVKLKDLKDKANIEQVNQLKAIEIEIGEARKIETELNIKIKDSEEIQNKTISTKEKDRDKIIEKEWDKVNVSLNDISGTINAKKNEELSGRGADTARLNEIENKLQTLNQSLKYIEDNRDFVAEYKKDKRELIDKIDEFKQEKQKFEKQLEFENLKHKEQNSKLDSELKAIQDVIAELNNQITIISEGSKKFTEFKNIEHFAFIEDYFLNLETLQKTEKQVGVLIEDIKSIHYEKLPCRKENLRVSIINFLGKFSENNILKFPKQLVNESEFLAFAKELFDFIEEYRIEQFEKVMNARFAHVVSTIGAETGNLMAKSKEIQTIIKKINDDFIEKNFVGVIKRIELKIEDSKNEIVQLLLEIKQYDNENFIELGSANIFTSDNSEKKNKKAIDLLKQFNKKINELKKDKISLSDSFELKFRIEENQNDTGWVEKLSNVGSEGTDTLVKAMVNIMLLNVFKENVSKKFKNFKLHCMMDEIGKLHPNNVRGILKFANERNIWLINSSPIENDALAFTHIYKLQKEANSITKVKRIITQEPEV